MNEWKHLCVYIFTCTHAFSANRKKNATIEVFNIYTHRDTSTILMNKLMFLSSGF